MGARVWLMLAAAFVAVLLLAGRTVTSLYVDHAWFEAMGAPSLFWERVIDTAILQGVAWIVGSLFAFANLHAVRSTILAVVVPSRVANIELTSMVPGRRLLSATIVLSLIIGAVLALPLTNWETVALVRHGVPFGEIDGISGRDLGHYVYWLPLEETMYLWALVSVVALTAMVLVLYALTRSLRLEGRRIAASSHVRRHLSLLGGLVLLLLGWSYRLDSFDILLAGSGPDGLFVRVDHRVTMRLNFTLAYGSAIAALLVMRTGWTGQIRAALFTLSLVLVAAIGLRHGLPAVLARGDLIGDRGRRDADYVVSRALYSRRAFDVDAIRYVGDSADRRRLHPVPTATATLANRASLWDAGTLALGVGKTGGEDGADARAPLEGRGGSRDDFDRGRLVDVSGPGWGFEHGRVTALRVERPVAGVGAWRMSRADVTQPAVRDSVLEIATGEPTGAGPPLVGPGIAGARLLDAATAGSVPGALLDRTIARVAHAWALRDITLLGADSLPGVPLLVTHRDVRARVRRLAPIFEQGSTVTPVLDQGRLYWVLHLYSASDRYPFSQRWQVGDGVFSYFRLAATAVVDAATGRVHLVPVSNPDPVARTWTTRWPRLFTAATALAPSLAAQLPPATEAAAVQLRTFARYGSRRESPSLRHLPDSAFVGGPTAPVVLVDGGRNSPSWSLPLLDERDDVAGVATVTGGLDGGVYWTAAARPLAAWPDILGGLRSVADSVAGAVGQAPRPGDVPAVRRGDTVVATSANRPRLGRPEAIVTSRGFLYVQTVQGTHADGRLRVRAVVVSDGRATAAGPTLADALLSLGEPVVRPDGTPAVRGAPPSAAEREASRRWYDAMREAMKQGDWSGFGAAFDSLGRTLGRPPQ